MAEVTRSYTTISELDEKLSFTSVNDSVNGKLAAMNEKLEGRMSEIFKAIRLISTNGVSTGGRNSPSASGDEMKSMPQFKSDDPISDLKKLEQTGGINEYYIAFDSIRSRINLPEELLLGWFISGLRIETRKEVRTFRPKTVLQAYAIGRLYEAAHPVNSIADSSHSVSPQQPPHQTIPPLIRSIDEESNQQEDEGVCVVLADSCILFEIVESDIAEIRIEQAENDAEFEAEKKVECSRFSESNMFVTVDAYQLFEEIPEPIPMLKMFSGDIFGISVDERMIKYGFISLIFDPGGENHKRRLAEIDEQFSENFSSKTGRKVEKSLMITEFDGMIEPVVVMVQSKGPNSYAHELFDEMSTPSLAVLIAEVSGENMLMVPSSRESFVHYGIVDKFVFDPGGGIQKVIAMECVGILLRYEHLGRFRVVNDRGVVINACNVCNELLELEMFVFDPGGQLGTETNEQIRDSIVDFIVITLTISVLGIENAEMISAEMGGLLLGDESDVFTVFDPGGNCVWPNSCYKDDFSFQLKLLPIHWDPGGCFQFMRSATIQVLWRVYRSYQKFHPEFFGPARCSVSVVIHKKNPAEFEEGFALGCEWLNYLFKEFGRMSRFNFSYEEVVVVSAYNVLTEFDDNPQSLGLYLLQSKPFKITIFDPGGGCKEWSILGKNGSEKEMIKAEIDEFMLRFDPLVLLLLR